MAKKSKVARAPAHRVDLALASEALPAESVLGVLRMGKAGALLMRRILEEGGRRGLRKEALAQQSLGVGRSYFLGLCSGDKDVPSLGRDAILQAARFLGMAPIEVQLLAGQLTPSDFYADPLPWKEALQAALQTMLNDPEYAPYLPPRILEAEAEFQIFAVEFYERATKRRLIPGKLTSAEVLKRYQAQVQDNSVHTSIGRSDFDRVIQVCRSLGITLRSARLRNGAFVDALGIAVHGAMWSADNAGAALDVPKAVGTFASELKMLDSVDPQPEVFSTGVVAAGLLALSLDISTLEFFIRLSETGSRDPGSSCPEPFRRILSLVNRKSRRETESTNSLREQEVCAVTLLAVELWKKPDGSPNRELSTKALSALLTQTAQRVRAQKGAR